MKLVGTLMEWMERDPKVSVTHPKLQESVIVMNAVYYPDGLDCSYCSHRPDGEPMIPYFGNQMPYVNKGKINYLAHVVYMYAGCGSTMPLPRSLAEDPNWEESKF